MRYRNNLYGVLHYLVNDEPHDGQSNENYQHENNDQFDGPLLGFLGFLQLLHSFGDLVCCLFDVVVNTIQDSTLHVSQ